MHVYGSEMDIPPRLYLLHVYSPASLGFSRKKSEANRMKGFHLSITYTPWLQYKNSSGYPPG
jgi:hypothetical protein